MKIRGITHLLTLAYAMTSMPQPEAIGQLLRDNEFAHRGHGGGHRPNRSRPIMRGGASKYQPHQGKREVSRRLARMGVRHV